MRQYVFIALLFLSGPFISAGKLYAQAGDKPFITVEGEVLKPLKLTLDDLLKMGQVEIAIKDRDEKEHTFKGVRLVDILDSAGVTLGRQLRGENLAKYILVRAVDGYEVVFSLPEVDTAYTNQTVLLVYQVDGTPLPKGVGPFRIIVPNDKRAARWIREIAVIKILFSKD